eukprot:CAMPEP_0113639746 /NCGR_PEP_ID=MMETSP0017_2-20120614/20857_1 /TAXON_ID=2856 /ORGANISM="Cylindrotheca closterium" /LENGTH=318 /DNA_ID=CAMNT_0000550987 /DNA_START=536 /DNA_END=1492 /DNA_ORIENTATION=+ /assembly_acc=CAM_ASM_000147
MGSKYPPAENSTADCPSQRSLLPTHEWRDNGTPTQITANDEDNRSSSCTKDGESSTANASKHTMVPVSGSPRDIICGRGLHVMNHHGNHNLHLIADRYRHTYLTSTRKEKAAITRSIVEQLKSTGARFLRRFNDDGDDKWVEVDDKTAYKKVSHALRLRKSDHGQSFLESVHRQQMDSQQSAALHSTPRTETISTSQDVAAMRSGPQNTLSDPSRLPSSSSLGIQLPLCVPQNQLQVATQAASRPDVGTHPRSIEPPSSVVSGYGNVVVDPRLFSQVFTTTLALMTQLQQQQRPTFNASSDDLRRSRKSSDEERRGHR